MKISYRNYDDTLYILLYGELDEHKSHSIREKLDDLLDREKYRKVIFDLMNLSFMDSTGIGLLIGRYKKLRNEHVPIYLCNPNHHINKILEMTGIYDIMPKI